MAMPCNGCTYYTYFPGQPQCSTQVLPHVPPMGPDLDQKSWVSLSDGCTYYTYDPVPPIEPKLDGKSWVCLPDEVPEASEIQDLLSEVHRAAAALKIQAAYRGHIVRKRLRKSVAAAIKIQTVYREHCVRHNLRKMRKTVYGFNGTCWGHVIGISPEGTAFLLSNGRICKLATYGLNWSFSGCSRKPWITKNKANLRNPALKTKRCKFGLRCRNKNCSFVHPGEKINKVVKASVNYDFFPANMVPLLKALPIMDPTTRCVVVRK